MAKDEGKSVTHRELPDPKIWKWCKHPECQKKVAIYLRSYSDMDESILMHKNWSICAVFNEDFCWQHLPEEAKLRYKSKIEKWAKASISLEGANLYKIELNKANLAYIKLQNANLIGADLQDCSFSNANLKNSRFIGGQLQNSLFLSAELQDAEFHFAELQEAKFRLAKLQRADFTRTKLERTEFSFSNLQDAEFLCAKAVDAYFEGSLLDSAQHLTWEQVQRVSEEREKRWKAASDAYCRLKNCFHQQGLYEDEAKAYYREKLTAQKRAKKEGKIGKWFWLFILNILAGFGEKIERTIIGAFGTILIFAGIYWWGTNAGWGKLMHDTVGHIKDFWHCLYFSVVTFATLGFGDIAPAFKSGAAVAAVIEVILGYVFLGTLITIIARKFGR